MRRDGVATPPAPQVLVGCVSMRDAENNTGCLPGVESARERYEEIREKLDAQLSIARRGFEDYSLSATEFAEGVTSAYDNMAEFYNGFESWFNGIDVDPPTEAWFGFSMSDFYAPEPSWPSANGITDNLPSVPSTEYMWDGVSQVVDGFVKNISLASVGTKKLAKEWYDDLGEAIDELPALTADDYEPPQYADYSDDATVANETSEMKKHKRESEEFVGKQAVSLNAFADLSQDADDDYNFPTFNFSVSDDAYSFIDSLYFPFEPMSGSNVNFKFLMLNVGDLSGMFVLFDYIYRGYRTLYIFGKFWRRSGLKIPDADMRTDKGESNLMKVPPQLLLFRLMTHPLMASVLILIFVTIAVFYLAQAYVPLYSEYVGGCVLRETNGTFISKNLYSITYNYASEDGNQDYFNGMEDYNLVRTDYCAEYTTASQEQQQEDQLFIASLQSAHASMKDDVFLMEQCIDTDAMDARFEEACCGKPGYEACSYYGADGNSSLVCPLNDYTNKPYRRLSEYLSNGACAADSDAWELDDAVFYCDSLPECTLTCEGPDREILNVLTEQCGCTFEWLMHSAWLKFTLAFTIYMLMNASRIMLTGALAKLMWRYFSPGIFTYKATCDYQGAYLKPPGVKAQKSHQGIVKQELHKTIRSWERFAWVQLAMSVFVNVPWIVFLQLASADLEYNPNG
jgi:hypothetical protein